MSEYKDLIEEDSASCWIFGNDIKTIISRTNNYLQQLSERKSSEIKEIHLKHFPNDLAQYAIVIEFDGEHNPYNCSQCKSEIL